MKRLPLRSVLTPLLLLVAIAVDSLAQPNWERLEFLPAVDVQSLAVGADGTVYVGTNSAGVYLSTDDGDFWNNRSSGLTTMSVDGLVVDAEGVIYAACYSGGVFRSTNQGESWSPVSNGITDLFVRPIALTRLGRLFVGSEDEGIFMSSDYGESWTNVGGETTRDEVHALLAVDDTTVVAGIKYKGICRTTDAGTTWSRVGNFQSPRSIVRTLDDELVAACYGNGVQYSNTRGASWATRNDGVGTADVTAVHHFGGHLLVATGAGKIFRSSDRGLSWLEIPLEFDGHMPKTFATLKDGRLLVGTDAGLYRSLQVPTGVKPATGARSLRIVIDRTTRTIRLSGLTETDRTVALAIFDVTGRLVAEDHQRGSTLGEIPLRDLLPGLYLARALVDGVPIWGRVTCHE